jgi:histidyl-tRNA synthetase
LFLNIMEKKSVSAPIRKAVSVPGNFDIVTSQDVAWQTLLSAFDRYAHQYGFTRVELPIIEDPSLYATVYGPESARVLQLVTAEAGGRQLALRSGLLPSLLRLLAQTKAAAEQGLVKWAYGGGSLCAGPKLLKTDYEFGLEVWGSYNHLTEVQVLGAAWQFFVSLGLPDVTFEVNTCGNGPSQESYVAALRDFLKGKRYELCDNCADSVAERPLAVLRCQQLDCQAVLSDAPTILDYLDEASRKHFTNLLEALEELHHLTALW